METKGSMAEKCLLSGDKVKINVLFRGRSITHPELGKELLDKLAVQLQDSGVIEQAPRMEGRNMTMTMAPIRQKGESSKKEDASGKQG